MWPALYTLNMVWLTQPKAILSWQLHFDEITPAKGLTVFQKKPIKPQILLAFKSHLSLNNPVHATFCAETYNTFVPR